MSRRKSTDPYIQSVIWRLNFDAIITIFQERKVANGTIHCMDYEKAIDGSGSANNPNHLTPSMSDFIADVELAARRVLKDNERLLEMFFRVYVRQEQEPDLADMDIDNIRLKVGRELTFSRVAPDHVYKRSRYIDRVKVKK